MTALILDGRTVAADKLHHMKKLISVQVERGIRPPGLAVIRIGEDPASKIYVNHKIKACQTAGITSIAFELPELTPQEELLRIILELNARSDVDGILLQLPLPNHIDKNAVLEAIVPSKDVDGFHPYNLGRLAQANPSLRPCTPFGIIQLLHYYDYSLRGLDTVVIGASNIVGRPMALEFLMAGATVTICHRATRNLEKFVRTADLVVVATGEHGIVSSDWLHDKQIIVDVGMHRHPNGTVHGDMNFEAAKEKVAAITPVPGGVGPMTISVLLHNTLNIYLNLVDWKALID
jgi:methylenetetrahydrofolate dehydrogenase (NADP+)/methenyltetrahydrofolate cyclohydrolase